MRTASKASTGRRRPVIEEIEPRILYSADFSPALLDTPFVAPSAEHRIVDDSGEFVAQTAQHQKPVSHEVVFVDSATPDYQKLIDDINAQSSSVRRLDVAVLDHNRDGIAQISSTLATMKDVSAVHLIGHGADGQIELGGTTLNFDSLLKNASQIKGWGQVLAPDADLLIYGCDVAEHADGRALVDALSRLTGADVAASETLTGAADRGGDWNLEYATGTIETAMAVSEGEQMSWGGLLEAGAQTPSKTAAAAAAAGAPSHQTAASALTSSQGGSASPGAAAAANLQATIASIPLAFEQNVGQADGQVDFLARGGGYAVALTGGDALLAVQDGSSSHVVRLDVLGKNDNTIASGEGLLGAKTNYLVGDKDQWHTGIANFGAVRYDNVYDGIDLRYYGNQRQLEYDFVVNPGADVSAIRLKFEGVQSLSIATNGDLVLALDSAGHSISFKAPVAYQDGPGGRQAVTSHYSIGADGTVGFEVGSHDSSRQLVIDPILSYGSYFGTTGSDVANGIAVDAAGNVYVTGYVPSTTGLGALLGLGAGSQVFVTKFSPTLNSAIYTTLVGGSKDDYGTSIAVDAAGSAYVTGYTISSDFPTVSAYQSTRSGSDDAFVFKLNATGSALTYSTYLGGSSSGDQAWAIAVDAAGSAYVAGVAANANFPTTAGAADISYAGGEAFITKLSAAGNSLVYSTFVGGSSAEIGFGIAVDAFGNAVVVGSTSSTNLPTVNAYRTTNAGTTDAFVAKLNSTGTAFTYLSYLGGSSSDIAYSVALDAAGKIYVTGETSSANFSLSSNPLQNTRAGSTDAFVSVIDPSLSGAGTLVYSTYLGGTNNGEAGLGIGVDAGGRVYVDGQTNSVNFNVTSGAYMTTAPNANGDAFLVVLTPSNTGAGDLLYGTYFGGTNQDFANTGVYSNGKFYIAGDTASSSGIATSGSYDTSQNGGTDAFVAVFSITPTVTTTSGSLAYSESSGPTTFDSTLAVSAPGIASLSGAVVQITGNYANGEDVLGFIGQLGITGIWDAATGTLTLAGTSSVVNYQSALRAVTYQNTSEKPSTAARTVTIMVSDGVLSSPPATRQITVASIDDAPINTVPGAQSTNEDSQLVFSAGNGNQISIGDVDAGTNAVQVTLSVTGGSLTLAQTIGLTFVTGTGTGNTAMTFTGTVGSINAALNGLQFDPAGNFNGVANLRIVTSDQGNTGSGGPLTATSTVAITVAAMNDAPVNNLPGAQATLVNTPLFFSGATGNAITVSDVDAGIGTVTITLSTLDGTLTLGSTALLTSVSFDGTATVVFSGALTDLNNALNGLRFTPTPAFLGPTSVQIITDDGGNTGSGGPASATNSVVITVGSGTAPTVTTGGTPLGYTENESATAVDSGLTVFAGGAPPMGAVVRIAANYVNGEDVLDFTDQLGITHSWVAATGTLTLTGPATAADYETALRSVTYQNLSDNPSTLDRTVSFVVNDGVADGPIANQTITVAAVNDAPVNTVPFAQNVDEDTGLVFSAANGNAISIADLDAGNSSVQVVLTAANGTLSLAQTSGLTVGPGADGTSTMTLAGTIDDINAALNGLRFDATPDFNGTTSIQISTDDGVALPATDNVSVTVAPVNDAPQITPPTPQTTNEGTPLVFSTANGNAWTVADLDAGVSPVQVTLTVTHGTLTLAGTTGLAFGSGSGTGDVTMTFSGTLTALDAALDGLTYTPTAFYNGSEALTISVDDQGNTGSGGPLSVFLSEAITITPVNSAPEGTNTTVTAPEDGTYVFSVSDFGFSDPHDTPSDNLLGVHITALPGAGSLTNNGVAVTVGQFVIEADIDSGKLQFTPAAGTSGTAYTSFTFQVQDDGGTVSLGVDLDQSPNVMTINVAEVNVAPAGADKTVTTLEDAAYTFAAVDFGFSDAADSSANALSAVKITTISGAGSLTDNGVLVSAGQFVTVADISGGKLVFTPVANANGAGYASFTFQVQDDGGTLNSGVDLDQSPNTMTVNVTAVNDAPTGTDNIVITLEDTAYTFAAVDFGFSDVADSPADALRAVKITTIPGAGSLTDNGIALSAGQLVSAADITAGKLKYSPAANANGIAYASFTFQVQDGGGIAGGGVNLDQSPNTMVIDVTAIDDSPMVAANNGVTVGIGSSVVIGPARLDIADPDNTPTQLVFTISGLPSAGSLRLAGAPLGLNGTFTEADLISGNLSYQSGGASAGTDSFVFSVTDGSGGTVGPVTFAISINTLPPPVPLPVVAPPVPPPTVPAPSMPTSGSTAPTSPVPSASTGEPTLEGSTPSGASGSAPGGETVQPIDVAVTGEVGAGGRDPHQSASAFVVNSGRGRGADPIRVQSVGPGLGGQAGIGGFGRDASISLTQTETLTISASDPAFLRAPEAQRLEAYKAALGNKSWVGQLDHMREAVGGDVAVAHKIVGSTAAISGAMSVGYVIWLLRGGLLLTSLLSSLPAWTVIDPMPVLARSRNADEDGEDDDPLEKLFGRAKAAVGLGHSAVKSVPAASNPVPATEMVGVPNAVAAAPE